MNRTELVRLAVLLNVADDYEEPAHIHACVTEFLELCGIEVTLEDVRRSLTDLIKSGLASAYRLSGTAPIEEVEGAPAPDRFHEYYFWITDEGKRALATWREEWPFDDEGELLPGWSRSEWSGNDERGSKGTA